MNHNKVDRSQASCCLPDVDGDAPSILVRADQAKQLLPLKLVPLKGGWFVMGADDGPHPEDGEGPARDVFVDPFAIASTAVSNQEFARFVDETGYVTVAEQQGWSYVFHLLVEPDAGQVGRVAHAPWWRQIEQARWSAPFGGSHSALEYPDHPVVHIALRDALSYCKWAGCCLPSEAQWEFAARGGQSGADYPWGNEMPEERANIWQGEFPNRPTSGNAFRGTCMVGQHDPNYYGLYNMVGNVWEWTADRFTNLHGPKPVKNPTGPLNGEKFVTKGGSYLCHRSYCSRYRNASRQAVDPCTTAGNVGFRVAGTFCGNLELVKSPKSIHKAQGG